MLTETAYFCKFNCGIPKGTDLRDKSIIGIAKRKRKQPNVGHKLNKKLRKLQNV